MKIFHRLIQVVVGVPWFLLMALPMAFAIIILFLVCGILWIIEGKLYDEMALSEVLLKVWLWPWRV